MAGGRGNKLTAEAQVFVVQSLARWETPSRVAQAVSDRFGVKLTPQSIEKYDPTKYGGAEKWRELFDETRKAFRDDVDGVGLAHLAVRLRGYQRMADRAEAMGNLALAKEFHELAAKDVGGTLGNKRVIAGDPDAPPVLPTLITLVAG